MSKPLSAEKPKTVDDIAALIAHVEGVIARFDRHYGAHLWREDCAATESQNKAVEIRDALEGYAALEAEVARLRGFEPCAAKMTDVNRETYETMLVTCRITKREHENASRNIHEFVGGSFDKREEGR